MPTPKPVISANQVYQALYKRYGQDSGDPRAREEWVLIREARCAAGFDGNARSCDLIAINTWSSRGLALVGHEIKVSRNDWLKELKQPEKAHTFTRHCDTWWIVVPAPWNAIVHADELPKGWGIMEVSGRGVKAIIQATTNPNPIPVPWTMTVAWLAGLDRGQKRDIAQQLAAARSAGKEEGLAQRQPRLEARVDAIDANLERLRQFTELTGIQFNPREANSDIRLGQLRLLWTLTGEWSGITDIQRTLDGIGNTAKALTTKAHALRDEIAAHLNPEQEPST